LTVPQWTESGARGANNQFFLRLLLRAVISQQFQGSEEAILEHVCRICDLADGGEDRLGTRKLLLFCHNIRQVSVTGSIGVMGLRAWASALRNMETSNRSLRSPRPRGSVNGGGATLQTGRSRVRVPTAIFSSGHTMDLRFTQPLTEMSTRNLPAG
jgi:hypothetical protein